MELRREGKSYTVDTLREISRGNPGAELYFLVGTDMLLYMEQWYEFRALFSLCTLAALPRADGDMAEIERYAAYLRETYGARIEIIAKTPLPNGFLRRFARHCRSAAVRNGSATPCIPRSSAAGCTVPRTGSCMAAGKDGRLPQTHAHTACARLRGDGGAARLALRWGEDPEDAAEAGILHDITKRLSDDEQLRLAEKYGIVLNAADLAAPKTLHALTGAWFAREHFGVPDNIFSAIEWHTTGRAGMTALEKIVYLADFIEPTRDFPGVQDVRTLAFADLNAAMIRALQMSMDEVKRRGASPHPRSAEALRWLKTQN